MRRTWMDGGRERVRVARLHDLARRSVGSKADAAFRAAIAGGNREAGLLYGKFLFQRDRFPEALFYFRIWTNNYPEHALPWSYLARCQVQLKHPKHVKAALRLFRELQAEQGQREDDNLLKIIREARAEQEKAEREKKQTGNWTPLNQRASSTQRSQP